MGAPLTRRAALLAGLGALAAPPALAHEAAADTALPPRDPANPSAPVEVPVVLDLPAGEVHVDPNRFALYWTLGGGLALRYRCGIGRPGLYEAGAFFVGAKKEWPSWTPTPGMIEREPELYEPYAEGLPGGPDNPLGARALYLFTPERGDTFLRIHGTNAPATIGTAVSNGCARLTNAWIMDLYDRVPQGARVVLYPQSEGFA